MMSNKNCFKNYPLDHIFLKTSSSACSGCTVPILVLKHPRSEDKIRFFLNSHLIWIPRSFSKWNPVIFNPHFPSYFNEIMSVGFDKKSPHDPKHIRSGIFLQTTHMSNSDDYVKDIYEILIKMNSKFQRKFPNFFSTHMTHPEYPRSKRRLMNFSTMKTYSSIHTSFLTEIKILNFNPSKYMYFDEFLYFIFTQNICMFYRKNQRFLHVNHHITIIILTVYKHGT